jgi:hypothetical protein
MSWQAEIPTIIRSIINDLDYTNLSYSDERLQQLIIVAAQYVQREVELPNRYNLNILVPEITPDPTLLEVKDDDFISFIVLKSVCLLDQSALRTRAALEGVRANLGPAGLSVTAGSSLQFLTTNGPCKTYNDLRLEYAVGNTSLLRGILSPFVGNKFEGRHLHNNISNDHRAGYFLS